MLDPPKNAIFFSGLDTRAVTVLKSPSIIGHELVSSRYAQDPKKGLLYAGLLCISANGCFRGLNFDLLVTWQQLYQLLQDSPLNLCIVGSNSSY